MAHRGTERLSSRLVFILFWRVASTDPRVVRELFEDGSKGAITVS